MSEPITRESYPRILEQHKQAMQAWRDGGKIGPPPPHPVKPHTPGWAPPSQTQGER